MHLLGSEGEIVPCRLDEGRGLFVVHLKDYDPDCDYVAFVYDGEEYAIHGEDYDIVQETKRVVILDFDCDFFEDGEESSSDEDQSEQESEDDLEPIEEEGEDCADEDDSYWDDHLLPSF